MNVNNSSREAFAIRISVIVTPVKIQESFLSDIDSCLNYPMLILSQINIRRVRIKRQISMCIFVTFLLNKMTFYAVHNSLWLKWIVF